MGVWHLSGLGKSPGAVTAPLTSIFLILKMAVKGNSEAQDFFSSSGEHAQSKRERGYPEGLILFTSSEVIEGQTSGRFVDKWFNTGKTGEKIPKVIYKYFTELIKELKDEDFDLQGTGFKYAYLVKVDHTDFNDCFNNIYLTIKALKDKEIWINMTGGTNQINSALLVASGFSGSSARNYYFFQSNIELMHPDLESKPNFKNPNIKVPPKGWFDIPPLFISIDDILKNLKELFDKRGEKVNKSEVENILGNQIDIVKLVGARLIDFVDNDTIRKRKELDNWFEIFSKPEKLNLNNFSEWKKYFSEKGDLWELVDGEAVPVSQDST
ncbi:MAG: hypothetical protein OdinLCB4_007385 [Candidatus Odinarchaeum yellowstonii]|uniref:CRISPR-associated protein n=1 Tax=Odinarchaeota yellowstonii (strain LCB_4) TaxID=1841599 RepID=A0AAF0D252_ODILC|nr:MAG: hypothetical protein OdinLCB4_007385 [Candidatus Odinarchaeum yellowstonii]